MQINRPANWGEGKPELAPKQIEILRSMYRTMGQKGVTQLALQDVADHAGVSKALLLYHFGTKENLILATMRWVLNRVAERIRAAIARVETAEAKLEAMIDTIFIGPEQNREFYLTYSDLLGYAARIDSFSAVNSAFRDTVNQMYGDLIALGVREGAFRVDDVPAAAAVVRALIDGLFIQWLQERDWHTSHGTYRELCKRSIRAYLHSGQ
jgi:AcrR family transcriptional regulator